MKYTTHDVITLLQIPKERLREWTLRGFVQPSIPSPGQGRTAIFTREDIYRIALFSDLIDAGFKRAVATNVVKSLDSKEIRMLDVAMVRPRDWDGSDSVGQLVIYMGHLREKIDARLSR